MTSEALPEAPLQTPLSWHVLLLWYKPVLAGELLQIAMYLLQRSKPPIRSIL
jgi:hypothetical protein